MAEHDYITPGWVCVKDPTSRNMDVQCARETIDCVTCGFNPAINLPRREALRNMNQQEMSEFLLKWARGEAWK